MADIEPLAPDAEITDNDLRFVLGTPPPELGSELDVFAALPDIRFEAALLALPRKFSWIGRAELAEVSQQLPFNTCVTHSLCRALETLQRKQGEAGQRHDAELFHQCVLGLACTAGVVNTGAVVNTFCANGAPRLGSGFKPDGVCPAPLPQVSRCTGAVELTSEDEAKQAIVRYSPIVALISAEKRFADVRDFQVYYDGGGPRTLNHALLLVGFDDGEGYWEVQNSFGTKWGSSGRGRIAYGNAQLFADNRHTAYLLY